MTSMSACISVYAGMLLLEMATGSTYHKMSFITEVEDEFCERQGLSGPDGSVIREILCSIFITCDATVDSLLANPFFGVSGNTLSACTELMSFDACCSSCIGSGAGERLHTPQVPEC